MQNAGTIANQQEIFASLLNSLPLSVYAKDCEGRFIHANKSYCEKTGFQLEQLLGRNDYDVHPKPLAAKYRRDDCRIMENDRTESIEESWQTHDGEEFWIQVIKAPLKSADGASVVGTIGVFWDITERKKAELELAEERNLLRTLIDNLPDFVYVKDTESRFLVANDTVAQMMGAGSDGNLLGKTDHDFFPSDQADKFRKDEMIVLNSGVPVIDIEETLTDSSGQERMIKTTKVPFKNLDNEVVGIIGIGHDITNLRNAEIEKKHLEKQLQHAQKMETIGTLTAGIAHDFNNLLSVINGYTELMKITTPADHKNSETLSRVLKAGRSAAKLVGQLLAFSRKQVAQVRVIDLNQEISARQALLRKLTGDNIGYHVDLADALWPVRIDPAQLEQIVVNLAENARDAMTSGGELNIVTENISAGSEFHRRFPSLTDKDWVKVSVRDTGHGITAEVQEHLFEPFFTTKPKPHGTGLGLATVFGIVKQNKGYIFVESSPGNGAEFFLFLPRSESEVEDAPADENAEENNFRGEETILVVEDDVSIKNLTCTILSGQGYNVYSAGNGAEALMVAEQKGKQIDLLLTDVIMPGMNGKMVATEITRRLPELRVLFMSGYTDDAIGKFGILDEGVEFIQKPFSAVKLAKQVRMVLDK